MTRAELAQALGKDPRTLSRWATEGMPTASAGSPGRPAMFDLAACRAWLLEREEHQRGRHEDLEQARARKEHWQALLAEQTHRARERELVPAAEVEAVHAAELERIKRTVGRLPSHAEAVSAAVAGGPQAVEAALKKAVYSILHELAGEACA